MIEIQPDGSVVSKLWASFGTRIVKTHEKDGCFVNEITHEWLEEGHDPPKLWGNKHWMTCTHRKENSYVVIREAEQVCVFDEVGKGRIHISVREGDWFQCKWIPEAQWHAMTELELISFVGDQLKNLRQIAGIE